MGLHYEETERIEEVPAFHQPELGQFRSSGSDIIGASTPSALAQEYADASRSIIVTPGMRIHNGDPFEVTIQDSKRAKAEAVAVHADEWVSDADRQAQAEEREELQRNIERRNLAVCTLNRIGVRLAEAFIEECALTEALQKLRAISKSFGICVAHKSVNQREEASEHNLALRDYVDALMDYPYNFEQICALITWIERKILPSGTEEPAPSLETEPDYYLPPTALDDDSTSRGVQTGSSVPDMIPNPWGRRSY